MVELCISLQGLTELDVMVRVLTLLGECQRWCVLRVQVRIAISRAVHTN